MARSSGSLLAVGLDANLANIMQTLLYALTTRLGAPGRDRYLLVLTLAIGLIAGWLTAVTAGSPRRSLVTPRRASRCSSPPATPARPFRRAARSRRSTAAVDRRTAGGSSGHGSPRRQEVMSPTVTSAQRPPVALYVHFPFCISLCPYCDFVVIAGSAARGPRNRIGQFLDALLIELELRADALDAIFGRPGRGGRAPLGSVYLGGGTPSLLPPDEVARLLGRVGERFALADDAEITLEANPGPDERGDPAALRQAGSTRISFGAQSFDDTELRKLGRRHRARHVVDAVAAARDGGIPSINIDLLYDIPDTDMATWMRTLDTALEVAPDHLSLYAYRSTIPSRRD